MSAVAAAMLMAQPAAAASTTYGSAQITNYCNTRFYNAWYAVFWSNTWHCVLRGQVSPITTFKNIDNYDFCKFMTKNNASKPTNWGTWGITCS